ASLRSASRVFIFVVGGSDAKSQNSAMDREAVTQIGMFTRTGRATPREPAKTKTGHGQYRTDAIYSSRVSLQGHSLRAHDLNSSSLNGAGVAFEHKVGSGGENDQERHP